MLLVGFKHFFSHRFLSSWAILYRMLLARVKNCLCCCWWHSFWSKLFPRDAYSMGIFQGKLIPVFWPGSLSHHPSHPFHSGKRVRKFIALSIMILLFEDSHLVPRALIWMGIVSISLFIHLFIYSFIRPLSTPGSQRIMYFFLLAPWQFYFCLNFWFFN